MQTIMLLLVGFILGVAFTGWLLWQSLHAKIDDMEVALHGRFTVIENRIAAALHLQAPKPSAAAVPAETKPVSNNLSAVPPPAAAVQPEAPKSEG